MEREEVYKLIDGERDYQDGKYPHMKEMDEATPVANWILYMEYQLTDAKYAIYNLKPALALEHIRKVTALGVACMENNETLPR